MRDYILPQLGQDAHNTDSSFDVHAADQRTTMYNVNHRGKCQNEKKHSLWEIPQKRLGEKSPASSQPL